MPGLNWYPVSFVFPAEPAFSVDLARVLSLLLGARKMAKKTQRKYVLVRWLEDEKVGVMPFTNIIKGRAYPGATVDMKWGSRKSVKVYEAESLKISGKSLASLISSLTTLL